MTARKSTTNTDTTAIPGASLMTMTSGNEIAELDDDFSMPAAARRGRQHVENEYDVLVKDAIATGKPRGINFSGDDAMVKDFSARLRNAAQLYGKQNGCKLTVNIRQDMRPGTKYFGYHIYSVTYKAPEAPEATE